MKRKSMYANMKASDLARITRERKLEKPNVITLSEWADFLEADDVKRAKQDSGEKVPAPDTPLAPDASKAKADTVDPKGDKNAKS